MKRIPALLGLGFCGAWLSASEGEPPPMQWIGGSSTAPWPAEIMGFNEMLTPKADIARRRRQADLAENSRQP